MVSVKCLLLSAAAVSSVLAAGQHPPPTGDELRAAAFWQQVKSAPLTEDTGLENRHLLHAAAARDGDPAMKDPYKGSACNAPYVGPPGPTRCNRNNCFRGFLNGRDGSAGKHCPKEAFGFCCAWAHADNSYKLWAVTKGVVFNMAPYARDCQDAGDKPYQVVGKINDVCGCTLTHQVSVDVRSNYYKLRDYGPRDPRCH